MTKEQKITQDAFLAGVDWTLAAIQKCGDIFDFTANDAALFRRRAESILKIKAGGQ